jgi:glucose-6-phosphate 1-dehydrogenase
MIGDPTLFTRADENEMAWKIIQPVLEYIQEHTRIKPEKYPAGTWGPEKSQQLIHAKNRRWRRL